MKVSKAHFEFKLQDFWVGAFWKTTNCDTGVELIPFETEIWICLFPCIPFHLVIRR